MRIMAYGSLAHGLLTWTMTSETRFEDDDWRRDLMAFGQPLFKSETFLNNLRRWCARRRRGRLVTTATMLRLNIPVVKP